MRARIKEERKNQREQGDGKQGERETTCFIHIALSRAPVFPRTTPQHLHGIDALVVRHIAKVLNWVGIVVLHPGVAVRPTDPPSPVPRRRTVVQDVLEDGAAGQGRRRHFAVERR